MTTATPTKPSARARRGCRTALLLIDVINAFDFPGSGPLVRAARRAAGPRQEKKPRGQTF